MINDFRRMSRLSKYLVLYGLDPSQIDPLRELEIIISPLQDVSIILLEDAVIGAINYPNKNQISKLLANNIGIWALKEDVLARGIGLNNITPGIKLLDYSELVDQIERADKLISWL
jgi:sulfur relay protein TusB/DsrH